jgi:carboxypeptidase family protein
MTTLRTLLSSMAILALAIGLTACTGAGAAASSLPSGAASADDGTGIAGRATAGPTCPVEKTPPDPACVPRPVVGAVVIVRDASGGEVAKVTTDAAGAFQVSVPAGAYVLEPQPAAGLMGTPASQPVTVRDGSVAKVDLVYDTGIRLPATAS